MDCRVRPGTATTVAASNQHRDDSGDEARIFGGHCKDRSGRGLGLLARNAPGRAVRKLLGEANPFDYLIHRLVGRALRPLRGTRGGCPTASSALRTKRAAFPNLVKPLHLPPCLRALRRFRTDLRTPPQERTLRLLFGHALPRPGALTPGVGSIVTPCGSKTLRDSFNLAFLSRS